MSVSREIESKARREFSFVEARIDAWFKKIELPGREAIDSLNARINAMRQGRQGN